ncbi:hypothetical protein CHS0354_012797 [Potamilus streckersoni]|uniref:Uncharacterized protein n=1 Tax=Potamilus streckersoni TaxID=2493646 RepID=A0AAE0W9N7_9BIVA|nr:hypothetical protein CHS0354_012797 [Potamilus streckersoni]
MVIRADRSSCGADLLGLELAVAVELTIFVRVDEVPAKELTMEVDHDDCGVGHSDCETDHGALDGRPAAERSVTDQVTDDRVLQTKVVGDNCLSDLGINGGR